MRFCETHWTDLRKAIDDRGLTPFVARGGADVLKRVGSQVSGDALTAANFEPLMSAHMAILGRLMDIGGPAVLFDNEDGSERCPICFANQQHLLRCTKPDCSYSFDDFIAGAADDQLVEARRLGLVPTQ